MKTTCFTSGKKISLCVGFFIFILIITEFLITLKQPLYNLGFKYEIYDPYFYVTKVIPNTPAGENKVKDKYYYKNINGVTVPDIISYRNSVTEEAFKKNFSDFYKYDSEVTLIGNKDENFSFHLKKLPVKERLQSISFFEILKFIIAVFMLFTGMGIVLFLNTDKTATPLVFSLYFLALTTANIYTADFTTYFYTIITSVLLDFGLSFTFTCIFYYFSEIFIYANYKDYFKYIKYIPASFFFLKYLHIFVFKWDISVNPFYKLNTYLIITCCIIFLVLFFVIMFTFPKTLTTTFKFFVLGLAFAVTPLLVDHFAFVISGSMFMTEYEKIYNIIAFIFLPFMLLLAIFNAKNLIRSRIVSWITSFLAYLVISVPIFITILDFIPSIKSELFSITYVAISPLIFYSIFRIMNKFFSLNTEENNAKLISYKSLISSITNTEKLHQITSEEINKILNCSFILFYKKNLQGTWDNLYTWGKISKEEKLYRLNESNTKKKVTFYKDGGFSIPIIRANKCTGVVYVGKKENGDQYLPGEHILIEQMISAFHSHWLSYTNNQLASELNIKNDKLIKMQEGTILSMANLIESRDGGTGAHVKRTAEYSALISKKAKEKGLFPDIINDAFIECIYKAAPMHDIGKIVVPDSVLKKPGKLTPEEFSQMKLHTTEGDRIVREILNTSEDEEYIKMTSEIAKYHHEKWNGNGYPLGIKDKEIPLSARILAIADVFDALVSPRCYKEPMNPEKAFEIIKQDAGTHFDPVLAEVFLGLKEEALEIMKHEVL